MSAALAAHERLLQALRDRIHTHYQRPPAEHRRGLGFMSDRRGFARKARRHSPLRGRKT